VRTLIKFDAIAFMGYTIVGQLSHLFKGSNMETTKQAKNHGKRTARHFDFGDHFGQLLRAILPLSYCSAAAATCRFELRGKHANRSPENAHKGYGPAVYLSMQTDDAKLFLGGHPIQRTGRFTMTTCEDAANMILNCFGICVDDVRDHYGEPTEYESKHFDLVDVVATLRPGLLRQTDPHAIATTAMAGSLVG